MPAVAQIVAGLDLESKLAQLTGVSGTSLLDSSGFSVERARQLIPNGVGMISALARGVDASPLQLARLHNQIQRFLLEQTPSGLPALFHEEAVAGLCGPGATQFPQALA